MNLIHKQYGLTSIHPHIILSGSYHILHILLSGNGGINLSEIGTCCVGYHLSQCGLSGSRRSIENNRTQFIRLDCAIQKLVRSYYMSLSDHLIKIPRSHTLRKRRIILHGIFPHIIKKVHSICLPYVLSSIKS